MPKPPKTIKKITDKVFEISDEPLGLTEWELRLDGMQNLFQDAAKRANELSQEMSDIEAKIVDWEHYIEFTKLNAREGYKAYSALNRLFEQRRAIKNEKKLVSAINRNQNCSNGMTEIINVLEGLKHQKYRARALPELFECGIDEVV